MVVDFETPIAALFARLSTLVNPDGSEAFRFATRRLLDWENTAPPQMPALMLTSGSIALVPGQTRGVSVRPHWLMTVRAILYCNEPDPNSTPSVQLNGLIAGVVNALISQPGETSIGAFVAKPPGQVQTTLGGLAAYVQVGGTIEIYEGLAGGVAIAIIPLEMVVATS